MNLLDPLLTFLIVLILAIIIPEIFQKFKITHIPFYLVAGLISGPFGIGIVLREAKLVHVFGVEEVLARGWVIRFNRCVVGGISVQLQEGFAVDVSHGPVRVPPTPGVAVP